MKLTNPEKLILLMLSDIYEKLEIVGDTDTQLIRNAIYSGNTWALSWELTGIIGDSLTDEDPPKVTFVSRVLFMWKLIEDSYKKFSPEQKHKIEEDASPFGAHVKFTGFDGNEESEFLNITRFMIEDMKRSSQFNDRQFNSHVPMVGVYQRMLACLNEMAGTYDHHGLGLR